MNRIVYKLSRPFDDVEEGELVIYLETLHDVYLALKELSDDDCKATHLEIIPIVHYSLL